MYILQVSLVIFVTQNYLGVSSKQYKLNDAEMEELLETCGKNDSSYMFSKVNFAPVDRNEKSVRGIVISQRHMFISVQSLLDSCSSWGEIDRIVENADFYTILTRICYRSDACEDYTRPNRLHFYGMCNGGKPDGIVLLEFSTKIDITPICILEDYSNPIKPKMMAIGKNFPKFGAVENTKILKNCFGVACLNQAGMDDNIIIATIDDRLFFTGLRPNGPAYETIFNFSNIDVKKYKRLIPGIQTSVLPAPTFPTPGSYRNPENLMRTSTENFLHKSPSDYYDYDDDDDDNNNALIGTSGVKEYSPFVFYLLIVYLAAF